MNRNRETPSLEAIPTHWKRFLHGPTGPSVSKKRFRAGQRSFSLFFSLRSPDLSYFHEISQDMSGVAQWLACWAHNSKVRGSKPRSVLASPPKNLIFARGILKNFPKVLGSLKEADEASGSTATCGPAAALWFPFSWIFRSSLPATQARQHAPSHCPNSRSPQTCRASSRDPNEKLDNLLLVLGRGQTLFASFSC